jgi:hypothetical protein
VCSFNYLDSENKKPTLSTLYQNQFISVHSNIDHEDSYPLNSDYLTKDGRVEKNSSDIEDESKLKSDFIILLYTQDI